MIYRFSQDNTSEYTMLQMMREGTKLDFDKLWVDKRLTGKFSYKDPSLQLDSMERYILGIMSFGIAPALDGIVYATRKIRQKVEEKIDQKNDIITVSAREIFFFEDRIKAKVAELIKQGHKVSVVVDGCAQTEQVESSQRIEYDFDTTKLVRLWDLNYELKKLGMKGSIKFNEFFETTKYSDLKTCWNLEQVIDANNEIDKIVRKIQNLKLSPYEAMVYIHKYLTQNYEYGYNTDKKTDDTDTRESEKNRSIVAAIQNKQTICAGYASMTKAIIDRLNMPGLKCEFQHASCWTRNKEGHTVSSGGHALNLITIEDPKYNIKGSYLNDATWDAKTKECPHGRGFAYFMYPVTDMVKLTQTTLSASTGSRTRVDYRYSKELPEKGKDSDPIPFDVFEKAVKTVYSLERDFCHGNDSDKTATEDIQLSLKQSWNSRTDDTNPLVKQFDAVYTAIPIYDKNKKLINVKFALKSQAQNIDSEIRII